MSALVMGLVWEMQEAEDFGRTEKIVLLAYADHADSFGRNVYPSVELIAKKTFCSERTVQYATRRLEKAGYLVADGMGPRGTTRWFIPIFRHSDGGARIAPVQNKGADFAPEGIAPEGIAPEPSVVVKTINDDDVKRSPIFQLYEQEIGALTPMARDSLLDAEQTYPPDWIPEAIQIAVQRNARSWAFVEAVLKRCKAEGVRPSLSKKEMSNGQGNQNNRKPNSTSPKADERRPDPAVAERVRQRAREKRAAAGL